MGIFIISELMPIHVLSPSRSSWHWAHTLQIKPPSLISIDQFTVSVFSINVDLYSALSLPPSSQCYKIKPQTSYMLPSVLSLTCALALTFPINLMAHFFFWLLLSRQIILSEKHHLAQLLECNFVTWVTFQSFSPLNGILLTGYAMIYFPFTH